MSVKFEGKVALVTGGGSGIGRATALAFAREGADVCVIDINEARGKESVHLIENNYHKASFIKADVSATADVEEMANQVINTYGRLDFAFNNAGVQGPASLVADYTEQDWGRVIDVNLKGIWLCMKYEIPQMLKNGSGAIVNSSSVTGIVGSHSSPAYSASKHGIIGLTKTSALQYSKVGIRINAVCPSAIRTPMLEDILRSNPEKKARFIASVPIGRFGKPEEVAEAVIWLCSSEASFITGIAMPIDGGWTAQ